MSAPSAISRRYANCARRERVAGHGSRITDHGSPTTLHTDASLITNHYPLITHLLIGSAAIRNDRNSSVISTKCISNRYKFACLRARCSRFLHSTNHQPHRATPLFLIAGEKILKTELTPSISIPNAVLIAGVCATFSPAAAPLFTHHLSLITYHCLTHHRLTSFLFDTNKPHKIIILVSLPMKTKEKQLSIRYKFALRAAGAANYPSPITTHQSLITPHKSRVTNRDSLYNCASQCAAGQSNSQPTRAAGHRQPARHETGFGLRSSNIAASKRTTHEPAR